MLVDNWYTNGIPNGRQLVDIDKKKRKSFKTALLVKMFGLYFLMKYEKQIHRFT